jgi:hypothetical protein
MNNRFVSTAACALAVGAATAVAWAAPEGRPCSAEPTDMLIEYSDIVSCEISPVGDADVFHFAGEAGEHVFAQVVRQGGGLPCVELFGPTGGSVGSPSCGSRGRIEVVLPASGPFTLRVTEHANDEIVGYGLTLERVSPPSPAARDICPNCTAADLIDPIGDLDVFSFTGLAGDSVIIQAMRQAGGQPCVQLFGPTGGQVGSPACGSPARLDLRLEDDGVHTILVSDFADNETLSLTLYFECFGTCGSTPDLRCEVEMSQPEYSIGDALALAKVRLANHGPSAVPLEWKLWMAIPGYGDIGLADQRFTIPKGYDRVLGPISFGQVTAAWPVGNYEVGCRFLEPASGRMRAVGHAPFGIH